MCDIPTNTNVIISFDDQYDEPCAYAASIFSHMIENDKICNAYITKNYDKQTYIHIYKVKYNKKNDGSYDLIISYINEFSLESGEYKINLLCKDNKSICTLLSII